MPALPSLYAVESSDLPCRFGRYEVLALIGSGGMARVFRAVLCGPSGFSKPVALKVMRPSSEDGARTGSVADFMREARLGALLKHPHIVDIYDLGAVDDQPYIAMELVEGGTIRELIEHPRRPPGCVVIELALAMATALACAHGLRVKGREIGLVHRDVKPSNVLIDWNGVVKLADFGIARAFFDAEPGADRLARVSCTPRYMAPEQAQPSPVDARADLFSFGVVLAEVVRGRALFQHKDLSGALSERWRLAERLAAPEARASLDRVAPGFYELLVACLAMAPEDRPANAKQVVERLEDIQAATPQGARLSAHVRACLQTEVTASLQVATWHRADPHPAEQTIVDPTDGSGAETLATFDSTDTTGSGSNARTGLDRFFGREQEFKVLADHLTRAASVVTVVGAPGMGKTRLSGEFAYFHRGTFPGGSWFCDCNEARTSRDIIETLASSMRTSLAGLEDLDAMTAFIGDVLAGSGQTLVVLDNLEHLLEPARELLAQWRQRAPEARWIVTSRERLRLPGEQVVVLDPLDVDAAVGLVRERAESIGVEWPADAASLAAVRDLVNRLDRMPLALELAAPHLRLMTPSQLLSRLEDRFALLRSKASSTTDPRHATLRGALDHSWELLDPVERDAFAQCAVFARGFFLEAAEAVLDLSNHPDTPFAIDALSALVDKSLLSVSSVDGRPRFAMYDAVRVYALDRPNVDRSRLSRRHALWFARFGRVEAIRALDERDGAALRRALEADQDNLLSAVEFAVQTGRADLAAAAARPVVALFATRGPFTAGMALCDRVLGAGPSLDTTRAFTILKAYLLCCMTEPEEATALLQPLVAECRVTNDRQNLAWGLSEWGSVLWVKGMLEQSMEPLAESQSIYAALGDPLGQGRVWVKLGLAHANLGQTDEGLRAFEQALALQRKHGHPRMEGATLHNMASLQADLGCVDTAKQLALSALPLVEEMNEQRFVAAHHELMGLMAALDDEPSEAVVHFERGLSIAKRQGMHLLAARIICGIAETELGLGAVAEALEKAEAAIDLVGRGRVLAVESQALRIRAECRLRMDDLPAAGADIDRAKVLSSEAADQVEMVSVGVVEGRLELARGNRDAAQAALTDGRQALERLGWTPKCRAARKVASLEAALVEDLATRTTDVT